jgi:hypothetical protein
MAAVKVTVFVPNSHSWHDSQRAAGWSKGRSEGGWCATWLTSQWNFWSFHMLLTNPGRLLN